MVKISLCLLSFQLFVFAWFARAQGNHPIDDAVALLQSSTQKHTAGNNQYIRHFIDLNNYPMARCLNGTPGYYYIRKASSTHVQNKWLIHLQGGGWCNPSSLTPQNTSIGTPVFAGIDSCYWRATSGLGGSSEWANINITSQNAAKWFDTLLSGDPEVMPMLYNWNVAFLRYCDGGSYSGRKTTTTNIFGKDVHFKGGFILEAFKDILFKQHNLERASDVVVSGCSAGGLGVYLHLDWWRDALPESTFVAGVADSGFFLDWHGESNQNKTYKYAKQMHEIFTYMNASGGVNQACVAAKEAAHQDTADCFFAQHTMPFLRTPIFVSQSMHDEWQISQNLGLDNSGLDNVSLVDEYADTMRQLLLEVGFTQQNQKAHAGMIDSCYHHCFKWDIIGVDGVRRVDAFDRWYQSNRGGCEDSVTYWQDYPYQNTSVCCGVKSFACNNGVLELSSLPKA